MLIYGAQEQYSDKMKEKITTKRTKIPRLDVRYEAEYVIREAQRGMTHVVSAGSLMFFCTASGDAWALDPEDNYALWLAKDGVRQPFRILEYGDTFAVQWDMMYQIQGEEFITTDKSGNTLRVTGYPTDVIENMIRDASRIRKKK